MRRAGVVVAESQRPKPSFKTGLPVRRYLPFADVQVDLLAPAEGGNYGRLVVGIAAGSREDDYAASGVDLRDPRSRLRRPA